LTLYTNRLLEQFLNWQNNYSDDPLKMDAFQRADRVANLLKTIEPVKEESLIPSDSVIREFIGGSSLRY
jgi:uridine kinase